MNSKLYTLLDNLKSTKLTPTQVKKYLSDVFPNKGQSKYWSIEVITTVITFVPEVFEDAVASDNITNYFQLAMKEFQSTGKNDQHLWHFLKRLSAKACGLFNAKENQESCNEYTIPFMRILLTEVTDISITRREDPAVSAFYDEKGHPCSDSFLPKMTLDILLHSLKHTRCCKVDQFIPLLTKVLERISSYTKDHTNLLKVLLLVKLLYVIVRSHPITEVKELYKHFCAKLMIPSTFVKWAQHQHGWELPQNVTVKQLLKQIDNQLFYQIPDTEDGYTVNEKGMRGCSKHPKSDKNEEKKILEKLSKEKDPKIIEKCQSYQVKRDISSDWNWKETLKEVLSEYQATEHSQKVTKQNNGWSVSSVPSKKNNRNEGRNVEAVTTGWSITPLPSMTNERKIKTETVKGWVVSSVPSTRNIKRNSAVKLSGWNVSPIPQKENKRREARKLTGRIGWQISSLPSEKNKRKKEREVKIVDGWHISSLPPMENSRKRKAETLNGWIVSSASSNKTNKGNENLKDEKSSGWNVSLIPPKEKKRKLESGDIEWHTSHRPSKEKNKTDLQLIQPSGKRVMKHETISSREASPLPSRKRRKASMKNKQTSSLGAENVESKVFENFILTNTQEKILREKCQQETLGNLSYNGVTSTETSEENIRSIACPIPSKKKRKVVKSSESEVMHSLPKKPTLQFEVSLSATRTSALPSDVSESVPESVSQTKSLKIVRKNVNPESTDEENGNEIRTSYKTILKRMNKKIAKVTTNKPNSNSQSEKENLPTGITTNPHCSIPSKLAEASVNNETVIPHEILSQSQKEKRKPKRQNLTSEGLSQNNQNMKDATEGDSVYLQSKRKSSVEMDRTSDVGQTIVKSATDVDIDPDYGSDRSEDLLNIITTIKSDINGGKLENKEKEHEYKKLATSDTESLDGLNSKSQESCADIKVVYEESDTEYNTEESKLINKETNSYDEQQKSFLASTFDDQVNEMSGSCSEMSDDVSTEFGGTNRTEKNSDNDVTSQYLEGTDVPDESKKLEATLSPRPEQKSLNGISNENTPSKMNNECSDDESDLDIFIVSHKNIHNSPQEQKTLALDDLSSDSNETLNLKLDEHDGGDKLKCEDAMINGHAITTSNVDSESEEISPIDKSVCVSKCSPLERDHQKMDSVNMKKVESPEHTSISSPFQTTHCSSVRTSNGLGSLHKANTNDLNENSIDIFLSEKSSSLLKENEHLQPSMSPGLNKKERSLNSQNSSSSASRKSLQGKPQFDNFSLINDKSSTYSNDSFEIRFETSKQDRKLSEFISNDLNKSFSEKSFDDTLTYKKVLNFEDSPCKKVSDGQTCTSTSDSHFQTYLPRMKESNLNKSTPPSKDSSLQKSSPHIEQSNLQQSCAQVKSNLDTSTPLRREKDMQNSPHTKESDTKKYTPSRKDSDSHESSSYIEFSECQENDSFDKVVSKLTANNDSIEINDITSDNEDNFKSSVKPEKGDEIEVYSCSAEGKNKDLISEFQDKDKGTPTKMLKTPTEKITTYEYVSPTRSAKKSKRNSSSSASECIMLTPLKVSSAALSNEIVISPDVSDEENTPEIQNAQVEDDDIIHIPNEELSVKSKPHSQQAMNDCDSYLRESQTLSSESPSKISPSKAQKPSPNMKETTLQESTVISNDSQKSPLNREGSVLLISDPQVKESKLEKSTPLKKNSDSQKVSPRTKVSDTKKTTLHRNDSGSRESLSNIEDLEYQENDSFEEGVSKLTTNNNVSKANNITSHCDREENFKESVEPEKGDEIEVYSCSAESENENLITESPKNKDESTPTKRLKTPPESVMTYDYVSPSRSAKKSKRNGSSTRNLSIILSPLKVSSAALSNEIVISPDVSDEENTQSRNTQEETEDITHTLPRRSIGTDSESSPCAERKITTSQKVSPHSASKTTQKMSPLTSCDKVPDYKDSTVSDESLPESPPLSRSDSNSSNSYSAAESVLSTKPRRLSKRLSITPKASESIKSNASKKIENDSSSDLNDESSTQTDIETNDSEEQDILGSPIQKPFCRYMLRKRAAALNTPEKCVPESPKCQKTASSVVKNTDDVLESPLRPRSRSSLAGNLTPVRRSRRLSGIVSEPLEK